MTSTNRISFLSILLILFSIFSYGQNKITEPSYKFDFLSAKYIGTEAKNETLLIFKYQPKTGKEFKPIFSTKIKYTIGDSQDEITEIIEKSNHLINFYGNDINTKNPKIYNLIKEKIVLKDEFGIVVFHLRNITKSYVDKMKFTYGLWEPEDESIRIEKQYDIKIDK